MKPCSRAVSQSRDGVEFRISQIALSDHAKLNSVVTDFVLAQYLLPLRDLSSNVPMRFKQLENDVEQLMLRPHLNIAKHRRAVYTFFNESNELPWICQGASVDSPMTTTSAINLCPKSEI